MRIVLTAAASVGLAVFSGPVLADGAYEGSYNAPLQYNWTGIYVGAHGGGAWGRSSDWFFPAVQTTTSSDLGSTASELLGPRTLPIWLRFANLLI